MSHDVILFRLFTFFSPTTVDSEVTNSKRGKVKQAMSLKERGEEENTHRKRSTKYSSNTTEVRPQLLWESTPRNLTHSFPWFT